MADEKQVSLLLAGIDGWNEWRKENSSAKIDLSRANLVKADLSRANLSRANLSQADLSEADFLASNLAGADLSEAKLFKAFMDETDLSRADIEGANLQMAQFWMADLSGANLRKADLSDAVFERAVLGGANLEMARLYRSKFVEASLVGAILSKAILSMTVIGSTDLSEVQGLEDCVHDGPSVLDHSTLEQSGALPVVFLRGCGLPENLIDYLPSLLDQAIAFYSCFISYSHTDKVFARRLHDQLQGKGIRCWLDEHQLKPGDDIYEGVDRGIRLWDKVLLCCSEASLSSWWVEREVDTAIEKEQQFRKEHGHQKLAIIPLNLDGHMFDWTGKHAATLRSRLAADFTGWEQDNDKFEKAFESVVAALRSDEQSREKPPPKL